VHCFCSYKLNILVLYQVPVVQLQYVLQVPRFPSVSFPYVARFRDGWAIFSASAKRVEFSSCRKERASSSQKIRSEKLRMAKVLFEGTKTFWKTKNSVTLTIIEHHGHDVVEVVAYEPALQVEAPRLYLEIGRIIPFLDQETGFLHENDTALASAISNFIFNRLRIVEYLPTSKVLEVDIQRGFGAREQGVEFQLAVDRPADLVRHAVSHSGRYAYYCSAVLRSRGDATCYSIVSALVPMDEPLQ
jgi:hypothetical protein